jgi:hypothetical protein
MQKPNYFHGWYWRRAAGQVGTAPNAGTVLEGMITLLARARRSGKPRDAGLDDLAM